jgi:hypothetical protein
MENQSFFDKNSDGIITISDIWVSLLDFLVYIGFYFQSFFMIFTNNSFGRFFEIDVIDLQRNTLLVIGLLVILGIIISIKESLENFLWKRKFKKEQKEQKEREK